MMNLWWRLVGWGFYLLYQPLAFTYDWVSWLVSRGAWSEWQRAGLAFLPPDGFVLDLAHGTGTLHLTLLQRGWRVVGCDLSPQMGYITQRKVQKAGYSADLVRGMGQSLPFQTGIFTGIICTFPTAFITRRDTLAELKRCLSPDGVLVLVLGASLTSNSYWTRFLKWLYAITGQGDGVLPPTDWLEEAGFRVEYHAISCKESVAHVLVGYHE